MASANTKAKAKSPKAKDSLPEVNLEEAKRTIYDRYELREVHRRDLKNAEYNPRLISDQAKKKLRENIKRHGLMGMPIWNPNTGNIIGGHQRVRQLDTLEQTDNYLIRVLVVPLSERQEKEQNVFLNNPEAQGEWDMIKLQDIFTDKDLDKEATGFDMGSLYRLFGDSPVIEQPERLKEMSEKLAASRAAIAEISVRGVETDDVDFFLVVVFKGYPERKQFTDAAGFADNRYIDGKYLAELLTNAKS